jgi:serine acetyltransferase
MPAGICPVMATGSRNIFRGLRRRWHSWFAQQFLVASIGPGCDLRSGCIIEFGKPRPGQNYKGVVLGRDVVLYPGVVLTLDAINPESGITIGDGTWINRNTLIYGGGGVTIGKDVLIAPAVIIWSGGHQIDANLGPVKGNDLVLAPIIIEDGAWIGAGAVIFHGVRIGAGAVIGGGSVITHDVPPSSIAVGNPAKVVRMRCQAKPDPETDGGGSRG